MATSAKSEYQMQQGREGLLVIIDNESEPGSWEREMRRAPWAYGQRREPDVAEVLAKMTAHGLIAEAAVIARLLAETKAACEEKT